jgi:hypothetical protein
MDLPAPGPAQAALSAEIKRMRALVERYSRGHRALGSLIRRTVDPEHKTRYVEIVPHLPLASIAQQPRRKPRPMTRHGRQGRCSRSSRFAHIRATSM